jgi:hypothetical protein
LVQRLSWLLLVVAVALAVGVRWRLLDVPLERDEGEYAYAGQLMLRGIPPYAELYNMKLPGIYAAYAVVLALGGESARGIHRALLAVNVATIVLVYLLGRRLFDALVGGVAAVAFATLSLGYQVEGMFANAEHFVLPLALAGLLAALGGIGGGRPWWLAIGGSLLGLAVLVKQHAAAFLGLALVLLLVSREQRSGARLLVLAASAAAPYLATCLVLWSAGVFGKFWFWTVHYAWRYAQQLSLADAPAQLLANAGPMIEDAPGLWLMAAGGLLVSPRAATRREHGRFVALLALCSFVAVCPGFVFRPHYFVLLLPAAALLAGVFARFCADWLPAAWGPVLRHAVPAALVLVATGQSIYAQREPLLRMTPVELSRHTYDPNPFADSPEIAAFIRAHTAPHDRVAIIGSEPQILFYSRRRSATGYIYGYPLMERHPHAAQMQEEMIREIEASRPELIVFVHVPDSWLRAPDSPTRLFEWLAGYRKAFRPVAALQILRGGSRFYTGEDLARFDPRAENHVTIFKRLG